MHYSNSLMSLRDNRYVEWMAKGNLPQRGHSTPSSVHCGVMSTKYSSLSVYLGNKNE